MSSGNLGELLRTWALHPVLVDVGASGGAPELWQPIAPESVYIGFDADRRELVHLKDGTFHRSWILNRALTWEDDVGEKDFFLTRAPFCSSMLEPDIAALGNYAFESLFHVEKQVKVPATSMNRVLDDLSLSRVHWFKTDSQGCDLRLLTSLREDVRNGVLAVDMEPGLIDAYRGEDFFIDAHRYMIGNGFWLSGMDVSGVARISQAARSYLAASGLHVNPERQNNGIRTSPGWVNVRYLRTVDWMITHSRGKEDYLLLWVFAMVDEQVGFALDIGLAGASQWGAPFDELQKEACETIRRAQEVKSERTDERLTHRLVRWLWRRVRRWV